MQRLSGTPAEAGVRVPVASWSDHNRAVSVEPPPKQGCETGESHENQDMSGLSGTPAEAGVRGDGGCFGDEGDRVSVEPPPKQGCESKTTDKADRKVRSQWNPRRSRGASTRNQRNFS